MGNARRRSRGCFQSQPPRFVNARVPPHRRHSHMAYMQILRLIHCRETRRGKVVSVGCVGRDTKSISKSAPASHSHPVSQWLMANHVWLVPDAPSLARHKSRRTNARYFDFQSSALLIIYYRGRINNVYTIWMSARGGAAAPKEYTPCGFLAECSF